ncbi:MAG TPA: hypothetical protein H9955_16830 [Candidatus Mediterraneibacter cottocaccae]|nr:hypothetical protein [Candidatus Mediterraneibacter cottocaccae]
MLKTGIFTDDIPRIVPEPEPDEKIRYNIIELDGIWELCHQNGDSGKWQKIHVPCHIGTDADNSEGFTGIYTLRKTVTFLPEQTGCRKVLKFEGINGYARVYVNGIFAAEHWNGFLTWNIDITELCGSVSSAEIRIEIDETRDRSGEFYHGGPIHRICMYLLPKTYISMLHITGIPDQRNMTAALVLDICTEGEPGGCEVEGILLDSSGMETGGSLFCETVSEPHAHVHIEKKILSPFLWDCEHPYLYTMQLRLCRNGEVLETVQKKFGFRRLERKGNRVYVNGQEIKLHGVCRHEISPLHGRCLTKQWIDRDVRLFKEANCNYIRTSHYPPSEYFLDACDREGIYVEDEMGLAFIAKNTPFTQRDPGETDRFLSHFREIMARDYTHPCVLIWSICNESFGGYNFDQLNRYIHRHDPTRLTKFSYPMTMHLEHEPVDVWSIHYTNLDVDLSEKRDNVSVGIMEGKDVPVIHDEYAHIPCYNREEHRRDPNVRNFWGLSIQYFWDKIWNTPGALGGAIWAGIDETNGPTGGNSQLEWGLIDIWRRRKPEFYLVRKAYSPVVIRTRTVYREQNGKISLDIENRFLHTNLNETWLVWQVGDDVHRVSGPDIPPGEKGIFCLEDVPDSTRIDLKWYDPSGRCIDEYRFEIFSDRKEETDTVSEISWQTTREGSLYSFRRQNVRILINDETARICGGFWGDIPILKDGPDLNLSGLHPGKWRKISCQIREDKEPEAILCGWYGEDIKVTFSLKSRPDGTIDISYHIDELNLSMPDCIKLRVSVSCGGLNEIGVGFTCPPGMDLLSWKRKAQWTIYPEDHIGRPEGTAYRFSSGSIYGREPRISWKDEMQSWHLNGKYDVSYRGTNDFRSQKENIFCASLSIADGSAGITALSDGTDSVRIEVEEPDNLIIPCTDKRIHYEGDWTAMADPHCEPGYMEMWAKDPCASAEVTFTGTGIVWYGPVDVICGFASVWVDGETTDPNVLQRVNGVDFPGSADGYDRKYHYPVFSISGLKPGTHTLRIQPTGKGNSESRDTYIIIEKFRILDGTFPEPIRMWINNACNYPMISWGNYCRPPILVGKGSTGHVKIKPGIPDCATYNIARNKPFRGEQPC